MDDSVIEVDVDQDSPVVSRTRSGLRLRAPAATPNAKTSRTPVRRTRKSVVREEPPENAECQLKTNDKSDECTPAPEATPVAETDATAAPPAEVSPQPDSNPPSISDQSSEKENVLNNTESCLTVPVDSKKTNKKRSHSESNVKTNKVVPFGKPKSGRVWKERKTQRFSALLRDKPLRTSWEKKMEAKREKQLVKQFHQQLKDEKARAIEEKKKRRVENLKRRAENERKAEIVQVIKNTSKIKRMKKKQLRKIEKRDTLAALQKTPPAVKKASGKAKAKAKAGL